VTPREIGLQSLACVFVSGLITDLLACGWLSHFLLDLATIVLTVKTNGLATSESNGNMTAVFTGPEGSTSPIFLMSHPEAGSVFTANITPLEYIGQTLYSITLNNSSPGNRWIVETVSVTYGNGISYAFGNNVTVFPTFTLQGKGGLFSSTNKSSKKSDPLLAPLLITTNTTASVTTNLYMDITEGSNSTAFVFATSLPKGVHVYSVVGENSPLTSAFSVVVNSFSKTAWQWKSIQLYRAGVTYSYQAGNVSSTTGAVTLVSV